MFIRLFEEKRKINEKSKNFNINSEYFNILLNRYLIFLEKEIWYCKVFLNFFNCLNFYSSYF